MKDLHFTTEEYEVMVESLESYLSDLRLEVAATDTLDFRTYLKHREEILKKILGSLHEGQESELREKHEHRVAEAI